MKRKLVWALAFCSAGSAICLAAGTVTAQQFRDDGYGAAPGYYGGGGYGGAPYGYDPYEAGPHRRGPYQSYNNDPDPGEPGYRPRSGQARTGQDRAVQDRRQTYGSQGYYNNDPDPGEPGYRPKGGQRQGGQGQPGAGQDARRDFDNGNRNYGGYGGGPYGYGRDYGYGYDQGPAPAESYGEREPGQTASDYDLGENANRTTVTEVANTTHQPPGTIVIDTQERHLYLTQANGQALQYGIGVGREGFTWKGTAQVKRKSEWPAWIPPSDMLKRRPDLPTRMEGGIENPLGARALYLFNGKGDTGYRIHGTNEPDTIGKAVSSGCIRMMNADVIDLYRRVPVGTKVVVL